MDLAVGVMVEQSHGMDGHASLIFARDDNINMDAIGMMKKHNHQYSIRVVLM